MLVAYSAGPGVFPHHGPASIPSRGLRRSARSAAVLIVSGALVVAIGLLILTNNLIRLNQFFDWGYV
jgi:hypothetical protein